MDIGVTLCVTLSHSPKCCSLLAGICCPRAARHSTAWCKWRAFCKWSNIFASSVLGSHATFLFHPSDSLFFQPPLSHTDIHFPKIKLKPNININICLSFKMNHGSYVPFHIFLSFSRQSILKGDYYKISALKCLLDFSSLIISVCLLSVSFRPFYQQLTKLHQLAMQQSPFPIAHSNQGFQGRLTDWKRECDCCRSVIIHPINTLMGFLCISTAGMDASAQTGSHELTIPNDVSRIYPLLLIYSFCQYLPSAYCCLSRDVPCPF